MTTVRLGDVSRFVRGVTFKPADLDDTGVGVMRTKNVQKLLDLSDIIRIPSSLVKRDEQYLREGDTLISSANSWYAVGKACWIPKLDEPLAIGGFVTGLRATSSAVDPRYLYQWFTAPMTQATLRSFGNKTTNISNLNLTLTADLEVPLPAVEEQRRIAAVLDQADAIRAKRRQILTHLDTMPGALYLDAFGDPLTNPRKLPLMPVRDLAVKFSDGPFGSNLKSSHYSEVGVPVIRLQNIGVGRYIDKDRAFVTDQHYATLVKHDCQPGDVLIGTLGDPNLRACIHPGYLPRALNKADCIQMRVDPVRAVPEFACWLMNMPGTLARANSLVLGQTRARISMGRLRDLLVPVPPLVEQIAFAESVRVLEAQRGVVERALAADEELFASLQSRAFRGEL